MNKVLLSFLLVFLFSCSKVGKFKNDFKTTSKIDPLAKAQTISDKFKDKGLSEGKIITLPIKVSLTSNTIGHYALDDIMSPDEVLGEDATPKQKKFLGRFLDNLKYSVYNMGLGMGISNRVQYSTDYKFPEIDPTYFKEMRVKKIFFAIQPCEKDDAACIAREKDKPSNFMFLDKFFLNISLIQNKDSLDFLTEPLQFLEKEEFEKKVDQAWGVQIKNFNDLKDENGEIMEHAFYNVNIARYSNTLKNRKIKNKNMRDNGNIFIARVNEENILAVKEFFKREAFKGVIKDITLLGKSLFVELYHAKLRDEFFTTMNEETADIRSIGINDLEGCNNLNCANIAFNPINLVPMLEKSSHIRFDTFVSIRHLDYNDFKYGGYLELEVKLELPL